MPAGVHRLDLLRFCVMAASCCALLTAVPRSAQAQTTPSQAAASQVGSSSKARLSSKAAARATPNPPSQRTFASAQKAAAALYEAARKDDEDGMVVILGPEGHGLIFWTDNLSDRKAGVDQFAKEYEQMHRLVREPDGETTLYVGAENWPFPIPLVERDGSWCFDSALGHKEILYRLIGENEMKAIHVLRALVDAEREYRDQSNAAGGTPQFALHLNSDQGEHDGLYWASSGSGEASPIGPYLAQASYDRSDRQPLGGYYFRTLTAQGRNAPGGARNYLVDGKMTGGFAFVAFPAEYPSSGVKTFIVNQDGVIYEKDLGPSTAKIAPAMTTYNPDSSWEAAP